MDLLGSERTHKYDLPLSHLEYSYIEKCGDVKELEKIVKVLRSGKEGTYPNLENLAEEKLQKLNPNSRALRKEQPISKPGDIGKEEWTEIEDDLLSWTKEMKLNESTKKTTPLTDETNDGSLPPVRGTTIDISKKSDESAEKAKSTKRVKPRDYKEWEKVNIDEELAKVDESKKSAPKQNVLKNPSKPNIASSVDTSNMTDHEKKHHAEMEKQKGNEAFRSGDYDEALLYYSRSLSINHTVAAHNNRAQVYLKLKQWNEALKDCNKVLQLDPGNIKGHMRRSSAFQGKRDYLKAKADLDLVLDKEPNNKRAQDILKEVETSLAEQKVKGRRMVIEEVDGSDDEDEDESENSDGQKDKSTTQSPNENKTLPPKIEELSSVDSEVKKVTGPTETEKVVSMETQPTKVEEAISMDTEPTQEEKAGSMETTAVPAEEENKQLPQTDVKTDTKPEKGAKDTKETVSKTETKESVKPNIEESKSDAPSGKVSEGNTGGSKTSTAVAVQGEKSVVEVPTPKVIEVPPIPPVVLKLKDKGAELFKAGQYSEAAAMYTKAMDLLDKRKDKDAHAPNKSLLLTNRAVCHSKVGDLASCIKDCSTALELTPGAHKPLLRRGAAYEASERYRHAYVDFRQVFLADSSVQLAQEGAARCQKVLQDQDGTSWRDKLPPIHAAVSSSANLYTQAAAQGTKSPTPGPGQDAKPTLAQMAKLENHKVKGNAFVQKGQFEKAIECYTEGIKACPNMAVAYSNRALCYLKLNQPENVVEDCDRALKLEPQNVKALFRRASANKMLKKYSESLEDLQAVLELDPANSAAKREHDIVLPLASKSKPRHKIQIQEDDSSSDEDDDAVSKGAKTEQKNASESVPVENAGVTTKEKSQVKIQEIKEDVQAEKVNKNSKQTVTKESVGSSQKEDKEEHKHSGGVPSQTTVKLPGKKSDLRPTSRSTGKSAGSLPTQPVQLSTGSAYEFIHAWTSLKGVKSAVPYVELLRQIQPTDLPSVLSNKLDGDMLKMMVQCVGNLVESGEYDLGYSYLQNLTTVQRFSMIAMFMSAEEKKYLKELISKLQSHSSAVYDTSKIGKLQKAYEV